MPGMLRVLSATSTNEQESRRLVFSIQSLPAERSLHPNRLSWHQSYVVHEGPDPKSIKSRKRLPLTSLGSGSQPKSGLVKGQASGLVYTTQLVGHKTAYIDLAVDVSSLTFGSR